ncbi:MAG: SDR family oxidoreductase [Rhodospirillales bacterium]|nr:SDR family oxidoreductase [Rhodospirillales bacterium]MDE2575716.1 SDR family oxidoreductase [Rhodospirillales bacterium]
MGARHALVTGGSGGIGAAIARGLSRAGVAVTVLGRNTARLGAIVAAGDAAFQVEADVTDEAAVASAIAAAEARLGALAILVNGAGAAESAPFARTTRSIWDRMIALNLTATFTVTQAVLPGMLARDVGRVINIASTAGLTGYPYVAAYVAAKHGVIGLTRALARETARSGVTVNAVCPGYTETELLMQSMAKVAQRTGRTAAEVRASFAAANPQRRLVAPEEVAAAVLFLCGPDSGAMTGQAIAVAGGEVM